MIIIQTNEFIEKFAKRYGYTKSGVKTLMRELKEFIGDELVCGESVVIKGLVSFSVKEVGARQCYDFKNGKSYRMSARREPVAELSDALKKRVIFTLND